MLCRSPRHEHASRNACRFAVDSIFPHKFRQSIPDRSEIIDHTLAFTEVCFRAELFKELDVHALKNTSKVRVWL